jgi:uncharacterized protein (DUF2252 family)
MELTLSDQVDQGRSRRRQVPRSSARSWRSAPDRPDPVALLAAQDEQRVAGLVPVRHARMAVSPFTFYRGAAAIMAADLASLPVTGLTVQLCGDAHLSNLGAFASPSRELLFDLNDFDETLRGPWEWDLHRLATSFIIAGRSRGLDASRAAGITATVVRSYRESMADFASKTPLEIWYARLDTASMRQALTDRSAKAGKVAERMDASMASARKRTSLQATKKLTVQVDGRRRFRIDPPVLVPLDAVGTGAERDRLADAIRHTYQQYVATLPDSHQFLLGRYEVVDIAHKVVGVGSVGMRAFVVLLESRGGDPLVLQFKEATRSVLEAHLPPSPYEHHGQRVVAGQRMMQAASDIFLGWSTSTLDGRAYYWRQLRDMKGSAVIEAMSAKALELYAAMCGWSLARAHARSGSPAGIAAYLGTGDSFDRAAVAFAQRYAKRNVADFGAHQTAIADGQVPSDPDV